MNNDTVISVKNVSKKYRLYREKKDRLKESLSPFRKKYHKDFFALNNINLQVKKGEILGIIGPNGAGKSTLLKIISGVIQPTTGSVKTVGEVVPLLELGSGMNPEFTGIENIYFSSSLHGYTRKQTNEIMSEIIGFADIGDHIYQPVKTYSSGMKARLAFAVSINVNPEILILDEILSVGDELFKRKSFAKMEEFFKAGKTIIYVTHSLKTVIQLCSRVIMIDKGEIVLEGPPKLVAMNYQKYLFLDTDKKPGFRQTLIEINKDPKIKKDYEEQALESEKAKVQKETRGKREAQVTKKTLKSASKPFFIPNFIPKSTTTIKPYGVDITNIKFTTLEGEEVNSFVRGEEYIYSFKLKFHIDAYEVGTSIPFKSEKGQVLTNANNKGSFLSQIKKGEEYLVEWKFQCRLLPGTYFTNIAVSGEINKDERKLLIRISDASAFKVQGEKVLNYGGFFCSGQESTYTRIK